MVKDIIDPRANFGIYEISSKRDIGNEKEEDVDPPTVFCGQSE